MATAILLDPVGTEIEVLDAVLRAARVGERLAEVVRRERFGGRPRDPDVFAAERPERFSLPESERVGHPCRVAEVGVAVERKVGGVERHVVLEEGREPVVARAGRPVEVTPEQAVVNHEHVRIRRHSFVRRLDGGVDRERGALDLGR